ncbi:MAG: hypothetical protein KGD74_00740 [Candidatus Lokiarchaeota archaeon]|nr:hypothetical protein [Candidatus Lokiarchaeota archaeon]
MKKKNTKKLELPISSGTGKPLKPFIKPISTLVLGIIFIFSGFLSLWRDLPYISGTLLIYTDFLIVICFLVEGCVLIYRAILGSKHVLAHQIIVLINNIFIIFIGFAISIIYWSIPGQLYIVLGNLVIILIFVSSIASVYWLVKLEKYKVKN